MVNMIQRFLRSVVDLVKSIFAKVPISPVTTIATMTPEGGWPGTIVKIGGTNFSDTRDGNVVMIGGDRALIISATTTHLVVLAGEKTVTGPIAVTTSLGTATSTTPFTILPIPDSRDVGVGGPPVFFHGPQPGTPKLHVADQPVLVLFAFPTDQDPGSPAARATLRNTEMGNFETARRYWQEASYNTTSWKFDYSNWLPLPQPRDYYMWQPNDVYDARTRLLAETKRDLLMYNGMVLAAHRDDPLAFVNVNLPGSPNATSYTSVQAGGTGIRVNGTRAFVSAGSAGFFVFDLVNSPPTKVKQVSGIGWCSDLDLGGNTLAVAALSAGVHFYDVSITALPQLRSTVPFISSPTYPGRQVTAVRLSGARAYVAADNELHVLDITNVAAPSDLANVDVGGSVLDMALQGTMLAVATDSGGIAMVDVGVTPPVVRTWIQAVTRVHGVAFSGGRLFAACGDFGLRIFDVSNIAAPTLLGSLGTTQACFGVVADGTYAYVVLGRKRLAVIDASDPKDPKALGTTQLGSYLGGSADPDLTTLRTNVDLAAKNQNLAQRWGGLFVDALTSAQAAGYNLDVYKGIVLVVNGPFLRGASSVGDQFVHEDTGQSFKLNEAKGRYYVATGADWGRIAHETGHWLGMWDIYTEAQGDGTLLQGPAENWCLSGSSGLGPLFCAHQISDVMKFYWPDAPANVPPPPNVAKLQWQPTAPPLDQPFDVTAHDAAQNTTSGRVHVIRLEISSGLLYFVEVRQRPVGLIFDQNLVGADPGLDGAVVITKATQGTTISNNTFERPITLFGVLTGPGQQVVDAARGLVIRFDSVVQARPLVCRVRVIWNQPLVGDPNGQFDLTITPWNTDTWETVDIWVDSQKNNSGATPKYLNHEPGRDDLPTLNGDPPWVRHPNDIYARIRNTGPQAVNDVYVSFYTTSPPGIGDNGNWALLGTEVIAAIGGYSEAVIRRSWQPDKDTHTCIKVAIFPQAGEVEPNNNLAQENVFTFDSAGGSSHEPVVIDAAIRSPFTVWKRVDTVVRGLPAGWHAVIDHAWVWTGPKGERPVTAVIWTDLDAPYSFSPRKHDRIPPEALARIEGWTTFDHRYVPIGGILAQVKATKKVRVNWEVAARQSGLVGMGGLVPPLADVPITVEIVNDRRESTLAYLKTSSQGGFDLSAISNLNLRPGSYSVQVFVTTGGAAAETETEPRKVQVL